MQSNEITILSERNARKRHPVSYDTILGMENAFKCEGCKIHNLSPIIYKYNQIANRMKCMPKIGDVLVVRGGTEYYLYVAMVIEDLEKEVMTLVHASQHKKLLIYCFDTWEKNYNQWMNLFEYINPYAIFFAYKNTADFFSQKRSRIYFLPQSMDTKYFFPHEEVSKDRLFMQMGRKNNTIHHMTLEYIHGHKLKDNEQNYVYEREPGKVIYPKTSDLSKNISKSIFFVCAPQKCENEQLTGAISDVTARFYEAMACKTLIIGFKPDTYDELFPRDSMVELNPDGSDFEEKISYFLKNPDKYNELVEKNFQYVMKEHTWARRLEKILCEIK